MLTSSGLLQHALQLAGRQWRIFPVRPDKRPCIKKWPERATSDRTQLERWWHRFPQANIGVATGNGLLVIDLDGPDDLAALTRLATPHGGFPRTLTSQTGRGYHLWFCGDLPGNRWISCPGAKDDKLLVRGTGGFVIAPPSWHASGRQYQWVMDLPPTALPSWFETLLQTTDKPEVTTFSKALSQLPPWLADETSDDRWETLDKLLNNVRNNVWSAQLEARVRSMVWALPANLGYDKGWIDVGMVLHHLQWDRPDGTNIGFEIWDEWSQQASDIYALATLEKHWASFARDGSERRYGLTHLEELATAAGWDGSIRPELWGTGGAGGGPEKKGGPEAASSLRDDPSEDHTTPPETDLFGNRYDTAKPGKMNGSGHPLGATSSIVFADVDKAGRPKDTFTNARIALAALGVGIQHDVFHDRMRIGGHVIEQWAGELSDNVLQVLRVHIRARYGFEPSTQHVNDAAISVALEHQYDPVLDYLDSLVWDGTPRLDRWMTTYLQAPDDPLIQAIARLSLIAAVRRAREPGCKFDQIIVLEGREGRGKSTAIELLAGRDNFSDQKILTLDERAQQEAVQGVWLYEISELAGIARAEIEHVKSFASRTTDRARPAYGRHRVDRPRRCVFFATTNDTTYLRSMTGNRRFWPVSTGGINLKALQRDRDQLWAEASYIEEKTADLVLPENLWNPMHEAQEQRLDIDPWQIILSEIDYSKLKTYESGRFLGEQEYRITTRDVLEIVLRLPLERQNDIAQKRVGNLMRKLGWEGPSRFREGDHVRRGYIKTVSQLQMEQAQRAQAIEQPYLFHV